MLYYPDGFTSPGEEIYGTWKTDKNIDLVDNQSPNAVATYSFSNITYKNETVIEITVKSKDIIDKQYEEYKIPDGTYIFEK